MKKKKKKKRYIRAWLHTRCIPSVSFFISRVHTQEGMKRTQYILRSTRFSRLTFTLKPPLCFLHHRNCDYGSNITAFSSTCTHPPCVFFFFILTYSLFLILFFFSFFFIPPSSFAHIEGFQQECLSFYWLLFQDSLHIYYYLVKSNEKLFNLNVVINNNAIDDFFFYFFLFLTY